MNGRGGRPPWRRKAKREKKPTSVVFGSITWCPECRKYSYRSRKEARRAVGRDFPGERGVNFYECPTGLGLWHWGHMAPDIVAGHVGRDVMENSRRHRAVLDAIHASSEQQQDAQQ